MSKSSKKDSETARDAEAAGTFKGGVAETAYYLAEKRGFAPGLEVEDWCTAEKICSGESAPR